MGENSLIFVLRVGVGLFDRLLFVFGTLSVVVVFEGDPLVEVVVDRLDDLPFVESPFVVTFSVFFSVFPPVSVSAGGDVV